MVYEVLSTMSVSVTSCDELLHRWSVCNGDSTGFMAPDCWLA